MSKKEKSCLNCKAQKDSFCLGRPSKHAKECKRYKSVCPKCKGTGLVAIGDGIRGLKKCPYCESVADYKKKHCISLDGFLLGK